MNKELLRSLGILHVVFALHENQDEDEEDEKVNREYGVYGNIHLWRNGKSARAGCRMFQGFLQLTQIFNVAFLLIVILHCSDSSSM